MYIKSLSSIYKILGYVGGMFPNAVKESGTVVGNEIFYNTFGSTAEVQNSEVGPDLAEHGTINYATGHSGNGAYANTGDNNYLESTTSLTTLNVLEGALDFYIIMRHNNPLNLWQGMFYLGGNAWAAGSGPDFLMQCSSNSIYLYVISNNSWSTGSQYNYFIDTAWDNSIGTKKHIRWAWDNSASDDNRLLFYIDEVFMAPTSIASGRNNAWGAEPYNDPPDPCYIGSLSRHNHTQGCNRMIIDEPKIYNYKNITF